MIYSSKVLKYELLAVFLFSPAFRLINSSDIHFHQLPTPPVEFYLNPLSGIGTVSRQKDGPIYRVHFVSFQKILLCIADFFFFLYHCGFFGLFFSVAYDRRVTFVLLMLNVKWLMLVTIASRASAVLFTYSWNASGLSCSSVVDLGSG